MTFGKSLRARHGPLSPASATPANQNVMHSPKGMPLQTKASIASDLQHLGVRGGQLLMVHSSLSSIGYVLGGAQAVVRALY